MPCPRCEYLEAELDRREREYAEAKGWLGSLEVYDEANRAEKIRMAVVDCQIDVTLAKLEIAKHRMTHPEAV
jgi:hypothetical protein